MLRITQQECAKGAKRYYSSADYYTQGQEIVGRWGGKGAERLGLAGTVDQVSFDRLCDNLHPSLGTPLTVRQREQRTVGYDFTFSVPKSVSLVFALTGDDRVVESFRAAVDETMREIEGEMATRVRKAGRDQDRTTSNLVWAEFVHTTSRPVGGQPDPQLHAHCFALNATHDDEENRWKAGQFRGLKASAPYFQAAFRVRLAEKLQDLGYGVARKRDDFEIVGVPTSAITRFSRRTQEIEKIAEERGITDAKRKAELGAETRERKVAELTWPELLAAWNERLSPAEREALHAVREVRHARPEHDVKLAVDHAIAHCFARSSVVPERKLLTEALKRGVGTVTVEAAKAELAKRPLIRANVDGQALATSADVVAEEERLVAFARKGRGRFRPLGDPDCKLKRDWFNAGQQRAIRQIFASRDRVTILRGAAGSGKTTLMQEAIEGVESAGRRVVVLAPSVGASHDVLRGEGFANADTVARFLRDTSMQAKARGQVIWVDEAGLLGAPDLAKLFDIAEKCDSRIVLSGDRRQHRAVDRGEPLKLLEERAGLPVAEVTEVLRQSGDYRRAVEHLGAGRIVDGFAELDRLGWICEIDGAQRYQELAAAYRATIAEKRKSGEPLSALVVSPTHAEAARVVSAIRTSLAAEGKLSDERSFAAWTPTHLTAAEKADAANYLPGDMLQFHQNAPNIKNGARVLVGDATLPLAHADRFEVYRPTELRLAVGDRVRVTANGKTADGKHRLVNGSLHTVAGFTPRGDITLANGWTIRKDFGHLTQGYCVTSHSSQGKSVDRVLIAQSAESLGASNRRQFYVSISRGKQQALVFTENKQELLRAVAGPDEPISALDLKATAKRASLFHSLRRRLAEMRRVTEFHRIHEPKREANAYDRQR